MQLTPKLLFSCLLKTLFAVALTLAPVIFIRRSPEHLFDHWQESAFYIWIALLSFLSCIWGFALRKGQKETVRQRRLVWGSAVFYFLYLAAAVLCERLSVGVVPGEIWRTAGFVLLLAGGALRLWSIMILKNLHSGFVVIQADHRLITIGPYSRIRHPSYLGAMIFIVGIPMIFGSWFPLLALPGVFVSIKWRMDDEEALLADHFGEEYETYRSKTWRLLPFVY